ncbi:MAG: glycosyltransferase family A protein [Vulcanimicrobiota bacterium]
MSKIDVILPVHNGERYLAEALSSLLAQSHRPDDIWVIDDGSTDGTAQVAAQFPVHYHCQSQSGAAAARNRGLELSHHPLVAFLDADDLWLPDKLELQLSSLGPEVELVFTLVEEFLSPELDPNHPYLVRTEPMPGKLPSTLLARRRLFERVGPFATGWKVGEFIDWYARAQEAGATVTMVDQVLVRRRIHRTNQGITEGDARQDFARILGGVLRRRRQT